MTKQEITVEEVWAPFLKDSIAKKLSKMPVVKALKEAVEGLERKRNEREHAGSDWGYWDADTGVAFWTTMVGILEYQRRGHKTFPPFPKNDGFLMDRNASYEEWAVQLLSTHKHEWEECIHNGVQAKGSSEHCKKTYDYGGLTHSVCKICSRERYEELNLRPIKKAIGMKVESDVEV